jgi:hypothetical protein
MRRAATAAFATVVLAVAVATAPIASASPAQDPLPVPPIDCSSLGVLAVPTCALVEQVEGVLAPVEGAVTGQLAPVLAPVAPDAGGGAAGGAATPGSPPASPSSPTQATSSGSATTADLGSQPGLSSGAALPRGGSSSGAPGVPVGSSLLLTPLALPSFGMVTTPAVTAKDLAASEAVAEELVLPAAQTAAQLPDDSKTTAVVMAFSMLLLAGGLLLDQVRKARQPVQL